MIRLVFYQSHDPLKEDQSQSKEKLRHKRKDQTNIIDILTAISNKEIAGLAYLNR